MSLRNLRPARIEARGVGPLIGYIRYPEASQRPNCGIRPSSGSNGSYTPVREHQILSSAFTRTCWGTASEKRELSGKRGNPLTTSERRPTTPGSQVIIIGAGPYGLSVAAHLRSLGVPFRIFGEPLDNWRRHMPIGMMLKSPPFASNLSDPDNDGTLEKYCTDEGIRYDSMNIPISLDLFTSYGLEFQKRFVPDLDTRRVVSVDRDDERFVVELDDGETLHANHVVAAIGITSFGDIPEVLKALPANLVSHSFAHSDLSDFAGRDVMVIGAGASAVDIATLLHEAGARTSLITRGNAPRFYPVNPRASLGPWFRISHPPAALNHSWAFWLYERLPGLFRYLPPDVRLWLIDRALGPATPATMQARFDAGVTVGVGETIVQAREEGGRVRLVLQSQDGTTREIITDHVIAATGYRPRVASMDFLSGDLRSAIAEHAEMPVLSAKFESSVPGLYFVGLPAVLSFGPLMRFVVGAEFAAPRLARALARKVSSLEPVATS